MITVQSQRLSDDATRRYVVSETMGPSHNRWDPNSARRAFTLERPPAESGL
jgi:hypothetical protein